MSKRALLVGCNYPGSQAALNGCINDVWGTKEMLVSFFGFQESDITVMIDTDQAYTQPTGKNIKAKLAELVSVSQNGDLLVFHFSGHGTQIPSDNNDEKDGKDEAICPTDMNVICDDDLRQIFGPLAAKPGVKLTFIADCCHSGTLLDHQAVVIDGPKPGGPAPPPVDVNAIQAMLASLGAGGNRDVANRSLPFNKLTDMLSQMLGTAVNQGNVRSSMASIFGADASSKVQQYMKYAQTAQQLLAKVGIGEAPKPGGGHGGGPMGFLMTCLAACSGGDGSQQAAPAPAAAAGGVPPAPAAGAKPPPSEQLPDEVGVLITGCQDRETSADACPSGDKTKAHGALSNALHTVVRQHFAAQAGTPLTYRNLVIGVRDALAKSGFAQNPCLECTLKYADSAFITCDGPVA